MTPQEILKLVEKELNKSTLTVKKKKKYLKILEKHSKILSFGYSVQALIDFAKHEDYKKNIQTAIALTEDAIKLGYNCAEIATISSGFKGYESLSFLCQYHKYLVSLGFSKKDILAMVNSHAKIVSIKIAIVNFTKLEQLGFNQNDIATLVLQLHGKRYLRFISENFEKLIGYKTTEIFNFARSPKQRPGSLNLIEPVGCDDMLFENQLDKAAKALLDDFNKLQTQTTQPSTTLTTQSTLSMQQTSEENSAPVSSTILLEKLKMALYGELIKLDVKSESALSCIQGLAPYLVMLNSYQVLPSIVAKLAILENPVEIAQDLVENLCTSLMIGYNVSGLIEIILRDKGGVRLKDLNKYHQDLTEIYHYNNEQIINIALGRNGLQNLITLEKNSYTLLIVMKIPKQDILEIINHDDGYKKVEALLENYDILVSLGFSQDQIIRLAKSPNAFACFSVLLACHADICKHTLKTKQQLVDFILEENGVTKTCWLYFYVVKYVAAHPKTQLMIVQWKKDLANMDKIPVLPEHYLGYIQGIADKQLKSFAQKQVLTNFIDEKQVSSNFFLFPSSGKYKSASAQQNVTMMAPRSNDKKRSQQTTQTFTTTHQSDAVPKVPGKKPVSLPDLPKGLEQALESQKMTAYDAYSSFEEQPKKAKSSSSLTIFSPAKVTPVVVNPPVGNVIGTELANTYELTVIPELDELIEQVKQQDKNKNLGCL